MSETGELPTTSGEKPKLPGGPAITRPIEINGTFYDPYDPPKLYQNTDGSKEYRGGTPIDTDTAYSMMFWADNQPDGMRETMEHNIETAAQTGTFSSFAGATKTPNGKVDLDQRDKEKLSAYRILAKEKGYEIGGFQYNENSGTAQASITRIEPKGE